MRILVFSDLHFFKDRLQVLESSCVWIAEKIQEHKPDMVVNCGDINHAHGYIDIEVLEALRKALDGIVSALPPHASFWMVTFFCFELGKYFISICLENSSFVFAS